MAQYYDDRSLLSGSNTPQFDVGALMKAGGVFQQAMGKVADDELQASKLAQEKAYKDEMLTMQKAQAAREQDKYNRELLKEAATSEAMQATLDPSKFTQGKLLGEQQAAEASIANLSPEEQVIARQQMAANYNPKLSGQQWLTGATSAKNVDQGKLFETKAKMYDIAASTPGTPEFQAKYDAEMKAARDKSAITVGGQISVLNAQKKWADEKEQKELDKQTKESGKVMKIFTDTPLYGGGPDNTIISNIDNQHKELVTQLNAVTDPAEKQKIAVSIKDLVVKRSEEANKKPTLRTGEEVRQELLKNLFDNNVPLTPTILSAVETRVKEVKPDSTATESKNTIAGYRTALDSAKVPTEKWKDITSEKVLKDIYDTEVADKNNNKNGGYGVGPITLGMMGTLGIDSEDVEVIKTAAENKRISDKDLAALIQKRNDQGLFGTMRHSGSIKDDILGDLTWIKTR